MQRIRRHRVVAALCAVAAVITGPVESALQAPDLSALHEMQRRAGRRLAVGDVLGALAVTDAKDRTAGLSGLAQSWNRQQVIELLAAVGRHRESLALLRNSPITERDPAPLTRDELSRAQRIRLQPAEWSLLREAQRRRVVMLNEEHWRPEHRAFGAALLPKLRRLGYRYLALETPDQGPLDEAMRRGRVTTTTDAYCYDPQRANLIRAALRCGMKIVAFDVSAADLPAPLRDDPLAATALREDRMAENIQNRILKNDPSAKIVVWVGMGHIAKRPLDVGGKSVEFMALRFFKRTGIDPYCVNQVSDSGEAETDRRVYRLLMRPRQTRRPVLYLRPQTITPEDRRKAPSLYGIFEGMGVDALVLHPLDPVETGAAKPAWQTALQPVRHRGRLSRVLASYDPAATYLVQALDEGEGPDAASTDQVIATADGRYCLSLFPQRKYRLRVWKAYRGEREGRVVLERPLR